MIKIPGKIEITSDGGLITGFTFEGSDFFESRKEAIRWGIERLQDALSEETLHLARPKVIKLVQ